MASQDAGSATPIPTTETAPDAPDSDIPEEKWKAMQTVLNKVYNHRMEDGYDPSKLFQRKINKRQVPDYYEVIKEPMALSIIKQKVHGREYTSFEEYVRDFSLITYNAQVYNRQESQAHQDALVIKEFFEAELKRLIEEKVIVEDEAKIPYLGEIPTYEDPAPEEPEEEEEEEEEEDDEEDDEEDEDEKPRRKRGGPRSTAAITKREGGGKDDTKEKAANDAESRKKRGRPPRVDTPMEARIKAIMKAIRKPRNDQNQLMVSHFERVPDKSVMPEYHNEIKYPMAMDGLKKKLKRKKYQSIDQFMKDVEIMFENAKSYNQDESQIYKDAVYLQKEARKAAEEEKKKPDSDYLMEDGRIPMPEGILHNGECWRVGDWVHIQNANDLTKPIVAQIYRTWQDSEGGKWVNACWYYRPEQTVHRFDRHFYENEVVKTGQYRDHPIDEVIDRCFVMFFTRYNKGRPRSFPADKEIYVCEARYNEEKHKLNKIKTWASCLPDEVRDRDYEMDLFDAPRKIKKVPSPIAYLLKDDAKESDPLPEPEWGAANAPPKIGAVHKRPRDPKESPPPEPTPSPPPQPPPPPRQDSTMSAHAANGANGQRPDFPMGASQTPGAAPTPQPHHTQPNYTPQPHAYHQHSASPAPMQPLGASHPNSFAAALTPHTGAYAAPPSVATPVSTYSTGPPMPSTLYAQQLRSQQHAQHLPSSAAAANPYATAPPGATPYAPPHTPYGAAAAAAALGGGVLNTQSYKPAQAIEVYRLDDHTNATIPPRIRAQFQQDEQGRVLFFTAPPIDALPPGSGGSDAEGNAGAGGLAHDVRYLAAKKKREALLRERKRKAAAEASSNGAEAAKKARTNGSSDAQQQQQQDERSLRQQIEQLTIRAAKVLEQQLRAATERDFKELFAFSSPADGDDDAMIIDGDSSEDWKKRMQRELDRLGETQRELLRKELAREEEEERWRRRQEVQVTGMLPTLED
ncbi:Chromatin structure-remodeling complex protein rsc1 [Lasiodiplodia theobromae]|uniref:Chromatin structure-remodeling complex protein rsc1 n=1 Tax=Lasiodiplodia theobromae TaxID=45133 RepID=UPI0015C2CAD6|nr:Chromatin structure-remodeling complex protein rsc1 [Lasiodiplodia theobromae]KAF4537579.1 Chromatin structure-remodeling complex protein rsc1 [Lasiodiplodia theobromae]